jgi:hypothetical protein
MPVMAHPLKSLRKGDLSHPSAANRPRHASSSNALSEWFR